MTDKATQIIANALVENLFKRFVEAPPWGSPDEIVAAMRQEAEHILAALQAARIELIEHPEPDGTDTWGIPACGEYNGWTSTGDSVNSVEITDDGIEVDTFGELTPAEARALAAALLAAAHTAETQP